MSSAHSAVRSLASCLLIAGAFGLVACSGAEPNSDETDDSAITSAEAAKQLSLNVKVLEHAAALPDNTLGIVHWDVYAYTFNNSFQGAIAFGVNVAGDVRYGVALNGVGGRMTIVRYDDAGIVRNQAGSAAEKMDATTASSFSKELVQLDEQVKKALAKADLKRDVACGLRLVGAVTGGVALAVGGAYLALEGAAVLVGNAAGYGASIVKLTGGLMTVAGGSIATLVFAVKKTVVEDTIDACL